MPQKKKSVERISERSGIEMGILAWIVVGLIAGWLAGALVQGHGFGIVGDIIVGIVGALIGGFIAQAAFHIPDAVNGLNLVSIGVAVLGSVLLIALIRLVRGRGVI
jgi:uncharacterized membrane protein YeaQ/YmgE (transglycosylase-associated protein family)